MSVYIVEGDAIRYIVTYLHNEANDLEVSQIQDKLGYSIRNEGDCYRLQTDMHDLNVLAYTTWYNKTIDSKFEPHFADLDGYLIQIIKIAYEHLRSWLYQCSECGISESALHQMMQSIHHRMAHQIAENSISGLEPTKRNRNALRRPSQMHR